MRRLAFLSFLAALAACGSNNSSSADAGGDAPVIATADAMPPDAAPPDALVCTAPTMNCGDICIDTSSDTQNCGSCGNVCQGGAYCSSTCMCPDAFVPGTASKTADRSIPVTQYNIDVGIKPIDGTNGQNALVLIIPDPGTTTQSYDLKGPSSFPLLAAGYNADLSGFVPSADAYYVATAGTITFDTVCAHELKRDDHGRDLQRRDGRRDVWSPGRSKRLLVYGQRRHALRYLGRHALHVGRCGRAIRPGLRRQRLPIG